MGPGGLRESVTWWLGNPLRSTIFEGGGGERDNHGGRRSGLEIEKAWVPSKLWFKIYVW